MGAAVGRGGGGREKEGARKDAGRRTSRADLRRLRRRLPPPSSEAGGPGSGTSSPPGAGPGALVRRRGASSQSRPGRRAGAGAGDVGVQRPRSGAAWGPGLKLTSSRAPPAPGPRSPSPAGGLASSSLPGLSLSPEGAVECGRAG